MLAVWRIDEEIFRRRIKQAGFGSSRSFKVVSSQIPSGSRLYSVYDYTDLSHTHSVIPTSSRTCYDRSFQLFLAHSFSVIRHRKVGCCGTTTDCVIRLLFDVVRFFHLLIAVVNKSASIRSGRTIASLRCDLVRKIGHRSDFILIYFCFDFERSVDFSDCLYQIWVDWICYFKKYKVKVSVSQVSINLLFDVIN